MLVGERTSDRRSQPARLFFQVWTLSPLRYSRGKHFTWISNLCLDIEPRLEKLIASYNQSLQGSPGDRHITLAKVDIDRFEGLSSKYKIQQVPTGNESLLIESLKNYLYSSLGYQKWQRNWSIYRPDRWRSNRNNARSSQSLIRRGKSIGHSLSCWHCFSH